MATFFHVGVPAISVSASAVPAHDAPAFPTLSRRLLQGTVALILLLRIVFAIFVPPASDAAYYWTWGQHLQWSYFDHPPMVGWFAALGAFLGGPGLFGQGLPMVLTQGLSLGALWLWADLLAPTRRTDYFWLASAIFVTSPLIALISSNGYPDHTLMPLALFASYFLTRFLADWYAGRRDRLWPLYAGAIFLGLCGLAKFPAIFLALGFGGAIIFDRQLRSLFASIHLYAAALVAMVIASPVLVWNMHFGFPTLGLHSQRFGSGAGSGITWFGIVQIFASIVTLSPFLIVPLWRYLRANRAEGVMRMQHWFGSWVFWLSTLFMLALATWSAAAAQIAPHWNSVAYVPFLAVAPLFFRSRWGVLLHLGAGAVLLVLYTVLYVASPVVENALGVRPAEPSRFGFDVLAKAVLAAGEENHVDFYAGRNWLVASRLYVAMGPSHPVTSIGEETDEFDLLYPGPELKGKSAIVLMGDNPDLDKVPFDTVQVLGTVDATRFGLKEQTYTLVLGKGYRPYPSRLDPH